MAAWRWRALVAVAVIAGGAWLALGKDATREKVIRSVTEIANRAVGAKPPAGNWGDVAKRIGDFAAEERGLNDSVNRAETAQPPIGK
jgi:hypothetical protein